MRAEPFVWGRETGDKPSPREKKKAMMKWIACGAGGRARFKMADVEGGAVRGMGPRFREGTGARLGFCESGSAVGAPCLSCPRSAVCLWGAGQLGASSLRALLHPCGQRCPGKPPRPCQLWVCHDGSSPQPRAVPAGSSVPVKAEQGNTKIILTPARSESSCCGRNVGEDLHSPCVRVTSDLPESKGIPRKLLLHPKSCRFVTSGTNKMPKLLNRNTWFLSQNNVKSFYTAVP